MALALKLLGVVAVTTYMLQIGLSTPRRDLAEGLRRKSELARALVVMLVLGPLAARLVAAAFALAPRPAVALVVLALVGVVPLASRGARSARGDICFAVVLTAALGMVSAFTAAPTVRLLLGYAGQLEVRTGALLLQLLLLQGVPLALGLFLRSKIPAHARSFEKVLNVFNVAAIVVLLAVITVLVPRYGAVRSLGWSGALAAFVFAVFIASTGYLLAGPEPAERRTLAALANKPNVVLALLIVTSADVDPGFAIAVGGVFLVRFFTGIAIQQLLARSVTRAHGLA